MIERSNNPLILAFDTATDYLSVAIGNSDIIVANRHVYAPRAHLSLLLPTIDELLEEAAISLKEVDALAVGIGPGSFTGSRIGVATAQGLAHGAGKPLVGISSLDVLAEPLLSETALVCPIIDAKRREVYFAFYREGKRLSDYEVNFPEELALILDKQTDNIIIGIGDGLNEYQSLLTKKLGKRFITAAEDKWYPRAEDLIRSAERRMEESNLPDYYRVLPIYIRLSDAEEALKRRKRL